MEITFANGRTATKAITVSLLEDGTFFAAFDDYKVGEADDFVKRADSTAIPRNILYGPDAVPAGGEAPLSGEPVRGGVTGDMPQVEEYTSCGEETARPAAVDSGSEIDWDALTEQEKLYLDPTYKG